MLDLALVGEAEGLPIDLRVIAPALIKPDHAVGLDPISRAAPHA